MTTTLDRTRITAALESAVKALLAARHPAGYWEGRLSSSALSTATALAVFALAGQEEDRPALCAGVDWLVRTQNADGGWGDTPESLSNLATSLLAVAALRLARSVNPDAETGLVRAEDYLADNGATDAVGILAAIDRRYGKDRTFAVPILLQCALAGMVPWESIPALPFELAVFPQRLYPLLNLRVVSYALPALIAVGVALHHHAPSRNPLQRLLRQIAAPLALPKLAALQPENGGFLEATPLTSFVAMSLLSIKPLLPSPPPLEREEGVEDAKSNPDFPPFLPREGGRGVRFRASGREHPVIQSCFSFLRHSVRPDGSWPIDTNLSVWLTSLSISALDRAGELPALDRNALRRWLSERQYAARHPFTGAEPGGWGWTHLPGGVPDADDTAGALLALRRLGEDTPNHKGITWLLNLQNADSGWPTFCRGWGRLPFDTSSPDITAHVLRALRLAGPDTPRLRKALQRGMVYLQNVQREDGSWRPLWFGNQHTPAQANPVLGTARVLLAYAELGSADACAARGYAYLCQAQNADGGWGGAQDVPSSIEETALALTALQACSQQREDIITRGIAYLVSRIETGDWTQPAPIGLYFASLWYAEDLYPLVWTVEALGSFISNAEVADGVP
ncbi:MAG: prenyltransferase/squalene oxidase repeat-containing protein [Armatimonadota bacterium]